MNQLPVKPAPDDAGKAAEAVSAYMEEPLSVELNDFHLPWAQKIPLATSHPYRFVIRKAYVKPSAKLDDPVDLNLTFARIVNSLQSKEGLLQQCLAASADKTAGRSLEDAVRGDQKLEAIRAAMRLPFYFSQNFAGVDTAHFPGCKLKVFVQTSGIVIADAEKKDATGAPFAHATLSFDDFIVDESAVADGVVSINAGTASADGKPFAIRCTSNIVADDLSRTLREYRTELLAKAQFAVGLGDFERDNFRFKAGTLIKILDRDNTNGWYQGQLNDVTEWFPRELAMLLTSENPVVGANKLMVLKGEALQKMNAIVAGPVPPAQTSGNEVKPIKAGEKNEKSVSFVATVEAAVLKNDGLRPKSVAVNGVIKDAWAQFAKTHMAVEEKSTKGGILSAIKTGFRSTPKPSQDPESVAKEIMARSKFTDTPIKSQLLRYTDPSYSKAAVELFLHIMQYMGDYPAKKMTPYMQVWYIIDVGMNVDAMCDEVFAQVIKQTVENKSRKPESLQRGWELIHLLCSFVLPTSFIQPCLTDHLKSIATDKSHSFSQAASVCLAALMKNDGFTRMTPPSEMEFMAIKARSKSQVLITFPDDSTKTVLMDTHTSNMELLKQCSERYGFTPKELGEFHFRILFEPGKLHLMNVAWHDPVADTMNRAPLVMNNLNTTYRANLIGFNLCFCRQFWLDDKDRSFSDAAIGLFYHQLVPAFIDGLIFGAAEMENDFVGNTVTKMVGCVARLFKKDANSDEMLALADELFPAPCLAQYPGEPNAIVKKWFKTSADAAKAMASMSDTAVQKEFLAHLKTFQNYGYEVFFIHGTNDPQVGGELLLAIGQGGMRFIDMDKRTITETVQYESIMNYRQNDREFVLRMSATKPPLVLFTQQGYVIAGLVDGYVKLRLGGAANGDDSDVGVLETLEV